MAGLNYYVKLPGYDMPDAPDVWKPISNALVEIRKGREADDRTAILQQQADTHQQSVDQAAARDAQALEDKHMNQVAGISQYIQGLPADDPKRAEFWKNLVDHHPDVAPALKSSGIDPTDHINGPQFITSRIAGYQDPDKKALVQEQIASTRAHGQYYEAAGKALGDRNDIRKQDADTRRLKVGMDVLGRYGNTVPPQEVWDRDSQSGGFLHTAFNGAPPSYADAPRFMQMAQARKTGGPNEQELLDLGLDPKTVQNLQRQSAITRAIGKAPEKGHVWEITPEGGLSQKKISEKTDAKQEQRDRSAPIFMQNLDISRKVLEKTNVAGRALASSTNGWVGYSSTKEALDLAGHAIAQLTAMVEGNRHANAQDVRFLQFFKPNASDNNEIISFKLDQAKQFFHAYLSNKAAGRTDSYLGTRFSSQVQQAYEKLQAKEGVNPDAKTGAGKLGTPQGMSNEELLRRLNE